MSSIRKLHKWLCTPTGYISPLTRKPEMLAGDSIEIVGEDATAKEYVWRISLRTSFRCNQAQYEIARDNAARHLMHMIYGPMEREARVALSACHAGDHEAAIKALSNLLNLIEE